VKITWRSVAFSFCWAVAVIVGCGFIVRRPSDVWYVFFGFGAGVFGAFALDFIKRCYEEEQE
jgi:hypothetical protein